VNSYNTDIEPYSYILSDGDSITVNSKPISIKKSTPNDRLSKFMNCVLQQQNSFIGINSQQLEQQEKKRIEDKGRRKGRIAYYLR
jgi:hypothetical protein